MKHAFYLFGSCKRIPDGIELAGGDGRIYEVVCPRWWRIDRWISWALSRRKVKGRVAINWQDGTRIDVRMREVD